MKRLRGLHALLHDTIDSVVNLVEETHQSAAQKQLDLLGKLPAAGEGVKAAAALHGEIAKLVYDSIRMVNRGVESVSGLAVTAAEELGLDDLAATQAASALDPQVLRELSWWSDAAQSALNAWAGDFLARRQNPLSIPLELFVRGRPVPCTKEALAAALPAASGKLCIFVHGLGCTDAIWSFRALEQFGDADANYGGFLERDLGYTSIYVRYNTGLHISQNGRQLSRALEELIAAYPVPLEEVALVGHSMGGLVSRAAAHYAQREEQRWLAHLKHLLCIGSPHLGAGLEQATSLLTNLLMRFDTPGTQVPAKLINSRSVGIKDLRFGYVLDEDWTGKDPDRCLRDDRSDVPMVPHVCYGFLASRLVQDAEHPLGRLLGDLLVSVPSAPGQCPEGHHVRFDLGETVVGVHHLAMLNHPRVYELVRRFLSNPVIEAFAEDVTPSGAPRLPSDLGG